MNKTDLIAAVAKNCEMTKAKAEQAVNGVFGTITEALADSQKVAITGFGVFEVKASPARTGRNPQTGEAVEIKARNNPKFRAGKELKDAVN
ncbi:MAG: HU family DNA-binding protein [Proteobacteria bacterium]|nr:HU family DNA-binding protein [Pseudomonadota bacterium]